MPAISSRATLITSPIPSSDHASWSCSFLRIRVVIGTPRSARMSDSSSWSQSIGLPLNCRASDWKKLGWLILSLVAQIVGRNNEFAITIHPQDHEHEHEHEEKLELGHLDRVHLRAGRLFDLHFLRAVPNNA